MAYSAVPTVTTGDLWTASNHNTYIRDNFAAGVPGIINAKGDLAVGLALRNAGVLPVTANQNYTILSDSSQSVGMKWDRLIRPQVTPVANSSWDGDSKSIGSTTITVGTFSGGAIPNSVNWVFVRVSIKWNSAGGGNEFQVHSMSGGTYLTVRADTTNFQDGVGFVPVDANGQFSVEVIGANVANAIMEITGWGY